MTRQNLFSTSALSRRFTCSGSCDDTLNDCHRQLVEQLPVVARNRLQPTVTQITFLIYFVQDAT